MDDNMLSWFINGYLLGIGCIVFSGKHTKIGGARGVVVIVVGNGHGDTSSNPGRDL